MRFLLRVACLCALALPLFSAEAAPVRATIRENRELRDSGDFKKAATNLQTALTKRNLSDADTKRLQYELDLLDRIRQDFSLNKESLFRALQKAVRDVTEQEFEGWLKEGRFESRTIDGEVRYTGTSVSNLFWRHPELTPRRITPRDRNALYRAMLENSRTVVDAAKKEGKPYVLPHSLKVAMTVSAQSNAVPAGELVRAWLPVPRKYPFQGDFKLIESSSPVKYLADENSSIRSAYLEQPAGVGGADFRIKYTYSTHAVRFDLDPARAKQLFNYKSLQPYLGEAPHVVFTPEIKKLAAEIVGNEKNPVKKARAIYNWIGNNILYSYALEYSTIPNISDYCRRNGYGDCGQQALLYITLCRAQGIPARWQSGWFLFPGGKNIHDWTEIYLEPWGWVPVDVEVGGAILRYASALTKDERAELHDFYFGGLDQYRLIANSDHNQQLNPPKNTFRSDDVDFQRGELETKDGNIYFNKYSYDLQWEEVR